MVENNNNNGKKRNDIFTKINDTISTFLDGYPPAVQTAAKVIVFGGMFLLVIGILHLISPIIVTVVGNLLSLIFTYGILALIVIYIVYRAKLTMTRDENSFLLNERLKYQKKEYEERERKKSRTKQKTVKFNSIFAVQLRLGSFFFYNDIFLLPILANRIKLNS